MFSCTDFIPLQHNGSECLCCSKHWKKMNQKMQLQLLWMLGAQTKLRPLYWGGCRNLREWQLKTELSLIFKWHVMRCPPSNYCWRAFEQNTVHWWLSAHLCTGLPCVNVCNCVRVSMVLLKNRAGKKHQLSNGKYSPLHRDRHVIMIIMIIIMMTWAETQREKSRIRPKRDKEITVVWLWWLFVCLCTGERGGEREGGSGWDTPI